MKPSGAIQERYKIVKGKTVGRHEYFFENGKLLAFSDYKVGQRVEEKTFFEDGQIESHRYFKKTWNYKVTDYYQNGKVKFEKIESDSNDVKFLTDITYKHYYDNGKVSEQGYKLRGTDMWGGDGVYNGKILHYTKSGHKYSQCTYDKGKPIKTCLRSPEDDEHDYFEDYDQKGILLSSRVTERKTDKQLKKTEFFPDGSTKNETIDPDYEKKIKALKK